MPFGLLGAALVARSGWEVQTEHTVLNRLHFAIDCAVISGVKQEKSDSTVDPLESDQARLDPSEWKIAQNAKTIAADAKHKHIQLELELAAELVMLPAPWLPYQKFWVLHCIRQLPPFKQVGTLPLVDNELFRGWCEASLLPKMRLFIERQARELAVNLDEVRDWEKTWEQAREHIYIGWFKCLTIGQLLASCGPVF